MATTQHKQWLMVWNTEDCTDGIEFDTEEEARDAMCETYIQWELEETAAWKCDDNGTLYPTEEQIEHWDMMIENCYCCVTEWDDMIDEWMDTYYAYNLSNEELKQILWVEYEELKEMGVCA